MELRQKTVQGMYWSGLQTVGSQAVTCVTFFVLVRLLEPKDYGLVAYANLFILFTTTITEGGMGKALTQRHELHPLHIVSAFWYKMGLGAIATVAGVIAAPWIAAFFRVPEATNILRVVSLSFLLYPWIWVQTALLQREFKFKALAARTMIASILSGAIGISCALLGFKAWSLVIQQMSVLVISSIVMFRLSSWRPSLRFSLEYLRPLLGFGTALAGIGLLAFFGGRLPQVIVGYFFGPVALGYFAVAGRFSDLARDLFYLTIIPVIFSAFSRLQKDPAHLLKQFYRSTRLLAAIVLPSFVGLSLLAWPAVELISGPKWLAAAPLLSCLALFGILECVGSLNKSMVVATGRANAALVFSVITTAWATLFLFLSVPTGLLSFTLFRTICGFLTFGLSLWQLKRLAGVHLGEYLKCLGAPALATFIMAGIVLALRHGPFSGCAAWVQLIALSLIGAATYGLSIFLLARSIVTEIREILALVLRQKPPSSELPL
jgi:O-antigen/teichoic acid export membrane protein